MKLSLVASHEADQMWSGTADELPHGRTLPSIEEWLLCVHACVCVRMCDLAPCKSRNPVLVIPSLVEDRHERVIRNLVPLPMYLVNKKGCGFRIKLQV